MQPLNCFCYIDKTFNAPAFVDTLVNALKEKAEVDEAPFGYAVIHVPEDAPCSDAKACGCKDAHWHIAFGEGPWTTRTGNKGPWKLMEVEESQEQKRHVARFLASLGVKAEIQKQQPRRLFPKPAEYQIPLTLDGSYRPAADLNDMMMWWLTASGSTVIASSHFLDAVVAPTAVPALSTDASSPQTATDGGVEDVDGACRPLKRARLFERAMASSLTSMVSTSSRSSSRSSSPWSSSTSTSSRSLSTRPTIEPLRAELPVTPHPFPARRPPLATSSSKVIVPPVRHRILVKLREAKHIQDLARIRKRSEHLAYLSRAIVNRLDAVPSAAFTCAESSMRAAIELDITIHVAHEGIDADIKESAERREAAQDRTIQWLQWIVEASDVECAAKMSMSDVESEVLTRLHTHGIREATAVYLRHRDQAGVTVIATVRFCWT